MSLTTWYIQKLRRKKEEISRELQANNIDSYVLTETKKRKGNEKEKVYLYFYNVVDKSTRAKRGISKIRCRKPTERYVV